MEQQTEQRIENLHDTNLSNLSNWRCLTLIVTQKI